jgi:hypothetical protein
MPAGGGGSSTAAVEPGPHTLVATDAQNGSALTARVGDLVQVRLGSTYWRFNPLVGTVLSTAGSPSSAPDRSCIPGGGCGTATQTYRAAKAGTAHVTAGRTTCGEVVRCPPNKRTYVLTVMVLG